MSNSIRAEILNGITYKLTIPSLDHAYYITINDDESGKPFEILINSRNMDNFPWIVALTNLISMIFRTGGNSIEQMINELESVFDPNGGYYRSGGKHMISMVAEIGMLIRRHAKQKNI